MSVLCPNRISVVIVAWNSWNVLPECIGAVEAAALRYPGAVEIIVVDNSSTDATADHVNRCFPSVRVLRQGENLGFPRACNIGLAASTGEFALLLNPDVRIHQDTFRVCVQRLVDDPSVGLLGVRLTTADGRTQPECARRFPTEWWLLCEALYLHRMAPRTRLFGGLNFGEWDHSDERYVPCLLGAFMLFRGSALRRLGGLDESVFMYFEDIDICQRVWNDGWRVLYLPEPSATHIAGSSRAKASPAESILLDSLKGEVAWRFMATHRRPRWRSRIVTVEVVLYAAVRLCLSPVIARRGNRPRTIRETWATSLALWYWACRTKRAV
ncbi:MAG: glycosyltransferase family 2 protein [Dehalococcoidia bacterium]